MHLNKNSIVDRGWESMEQILDKEMPQKKKRRFFVWWLVGLFFISTSGIYIAYSQFFKSDTIAQINPDLSSNDATQDVIKNDVNNESLSSNETNEILESTSGENKLSKKEASTQFNEIDNSRKSDNFQNLKSNNTVTLGSDVELAEKLASTNNSKPEGTKSLSQADISATQNDESKAEFRKVTKDDITNINNPNLQNTDIQAESDLNSLAKNNSIKPDEYKIDLDSRIDESIPVIEEDVTIENIEEKRLPSSNTALIAGTNNEEQKLTDTKIQTPSTNTETPKGVSSNPKPSTTTGKALIQIALLPMVNNYLITDPLLPSKLPVMVYTPSQAKFQPLSDIRIGLFAGYIYNDKAFSGEVNGIYTRQLNTKWGLGVGLGTGVHFHKSEDQNGILTSFSERSNQLPQLPQGPQGAQGAPAPAGEADSAEGMGGTGETGSKTFEVTEDLRQELSQQSAKSSQYISAEGILLFAPSSKLEFSASIGYDYLYKTNFDDIYLIDNSFLSFELLDNAESINLTVPEKWLPMSQFYVSYAINRRLKLSAGLKYFYKQIFPESGPNLNQFKFGIQTVIPMRRK